MLCPICKQETVAGESVCRACGSIIIRYSAPEGFLLDKASGKYTRIDEITNEQGVVERWATVFDAYEGTYTQELLPDMHIPRHITVPPPPVTPPSAPALTTPRVISAKQPPLTQPKVNRKAAAFTIIIPIAALLIGAGIAFFQLGGLSLLQKNTAFDMPVTVEKIELDTASMPVFTPFSTADPTEQTQSDDPPIQPVVSVKAQLGVGGYTITEEMKNADNLPSIGAYVVEALEGGSAQQAGIKAEDIIVGFNALKITTIDELIAAVGAANAGDLVRVQLYRGSQLLQIDVVLGKAPDNPVNQAINDIPETPPPPSEIAADMVFSVDGFVLGKATLDDVVKRYSSRADYMFVDNYALNADDDVAAVMNNTSNSGYLFVQHYDASKLTLMYIADPSILCLEKYHAGEEAAALLRDLGAPADVLSLSIGKNTIYNESGKSLVVDRIDDSKYELDYCQNGKVAFIRVKNNKIDYLYLYFKDGY